MMKSVIRTGLSLAACTAVAVAGFASIVIDEDGIGFVGKGDVQDAFGWNNHMLQANAAAVEFRFAEERTVSYGCEWWTGPAHNQQYHSTTHTVTQDIAASVAFDARKNRQGQITGFNLNGFMGEEQSDYAEPDCGGHGAGKTLIEGSITIEDGDGALLQVKLINEDDESWRDLLLPEDDEE
jgi:hypothetical protein